MNRKRKAYDLVMNSVTYLSAALAALILFLVVLFMFQRGWSGVRLDLLTGSYWSANYNIGYESFQPGSFSAPEGLKEGVSFSPRLGVAVSDHQDAYKEHQVLVEYIAPGSPLAKGKVITAGPSYGQELTLEKGSNLINLNLLDAAGKPLQVGAQKKNTAQEVAQAMESATKVQGLYFKTQGGGIRGSILATLYLIALSLIFALPVGIAAAIYLNEYAKPGKITNLMRSSIEILSGVPSIIFGLMGVSVLFPITQLMGIHTISILLGALTMSVVLLPLIIRQTEESLKVVPIALRDASLSLGATQTQTIFRVVLPSALPGILTATLLSISRIIGESAALIYTMGTFIVDKPQLNQGATTLAVTIWSLMVGEQPNFELSSTISIIILAMVLILNITVKLISARLNRKWSA
ncbi:Phosphate transport system permease protein PstA [Clostridiaceae bacterium JG1575]|nr:Phosphate transport system permease protein PstA [Clostridiaceae bacterium JG1575]